MDSTLSYPHTGKFGPCRFEVIEKSDAGSYNRESMKYKILGQSPREGKRWQIGEATARTLEKAGKIEIVDGVVKRAVYPEDEQDKIQYKPFWSLMLATDVGTAQTGKDELNTIMGAPMGFDTEHCYNIAVGKLGENSPLYNPESTVDDDMEDLLRLTDRLRHCPGVEAVALSQNCFPYNEGSNSIELGIDSVPVSARLLWADADFFRVFRYSFTEEDDFNKVEAAFRNDELVVSSNLTEGHPELDAGSAASLQGKEVLLLNYGQDVRRRIGAVGTPVRWSHFQTSAQWGGAFAALPLDVKRLRSFGDPRYVTVSLRVSEDADKGFAEKLMDDADRLYQVGNLYLLDITPFVHLREICELEDMNEWKTQLCVLGFLLLNIFLGVIGTFWFRTQQRRKEIALRLAMGSPRRGIFSYLMYEGILLLTLAVIPATVIAFNIGYAELVDVGRMPFDTGRFLSALVVTWMLMALMIVAGIWYPAYGAMRVHPAKALHDE